MLGFTGVECRRTAPSSPGSRACACLANCKPLTRALNVLAALRRCLKFARSLCRCLSWLCSVPAFCIEQDVQKLAAQGQLDLAWQKSVRNHPSNLISSSIIRPCAHRACFNVAPANLLTRAYTLHRTGPSEAAPDRRSDCDAPHHHRENRPTTVVPESITSPHL